MNTAVPYSFASGRYVVENTLGIGSMGVVYEVIDRERNMRVALKTLLRMGTDNLYYFKKEFRALHDLVHPNLCSLMELHKDEDTWFYTMELVNGLDFLTYVASSPNSLSSSPPADPTTHPTPATKGNASSCSLRYDEQRLRSSLAGLCQGLHALHSAGKVHRDIKPSNVLVNPDGRVVLLDFGFVTEKESSKQTDMNALVGSAAYMAPEQAECEAVGPEADLYAVGVMLYRALTGELPFSGSPIQILIGKQATDPTPPNQIVEGLPDDLALICMALMSRNPISRPSIFETVEAIRLDRPTPLTSEINNLSLVNQDAVFVGRDSELRLLKKTYEGTRKGSPGIVVVEGVSGVGKTRLLEQLIQEVTALDPSAVILAGRCYERESAPFKAFDGVVDSLIAHVKKLGEDEASGLRSSGLQLLEGLFPAIKRSGFWSTTETIPPKIEDPVELQRRSFEAFRETLTRLCYGHPLVVIIDDLQWADPDSLAFLKDLVGGAEMPPFLVILVSRCAEDTETSVWEWDELINNPYQKLHLKALEPKDSEELALQFMSRAGTSIELDPMAIAIEAEGHPLYIAELVHHLAQGAEEWRSLRIDEVISARVKNLSKNARLLLRIICVIGTPISRAHLRAISALPAGEFYETIRTLRANNLIRSTGPKISDIIESFHDRVREAVVAHDMTVQETTRINFDIGQFYLRTYSDEELNDNLFFVVQHLSEGIEHITTSSEKELLAELYFRAGKQSRGSAAFVSSLVYFKESISLFSESAWDSHYETMFALHCSAAESAYITGDFGLTKQLTLEANSRAKSHLDRARIYETYVLSLVADGKPQNALDEAIGMVRHLGVKLPAHPSKAYLFTKLLLTKLRLFRTSPQKIQSLPYTVNRHIIAARRLFGTISDIAFLNRPLLWPAFLFKLIELLFKYGIDYNSTMTIIGWAALNCIVLKNYKEGRKFGHLAVNLLPQFEEQNKAPMTLVIWATFVQHWTEPLSATLPHLLKSREIAYKTGNRLYFGYASSNICYHSFYTGKALPELVENLYDYGDEIKQKNLEMSHTTVCIFLQTAKNLMNEFESVFPTKLQGTEYRENEMVPYHRENKQKLNLFDYYQCKLLLCVYFNEYQDALETAAELWRYAFTAAGTYAISVAPFYESLVFLKHHKVAEVKLRKQLLRRVRVNQRKYKKVALSSPANHAHKFVLVEAERNRVRGKYQKAESLYAEAMAGAVQRGFTQDAALAAEFAADFYSETGNHKSALSAAHRALTFYEKWGAFAKAQHLKKKFRL